MGQSDPSANRPITAWLPDDAWRPITDPEFREQRRDLEQRIGRDLATVADRMAPTAYADAITWTAGLHADGAAREDPRRINLKQIRSDDTAGYRQALESIGPARDQASDQARDQASNPTLLVAVSLNIHSRFVLPMTWRRCLEHLAPLPVWAVATDGSWLFLSDPTDFAVSGRPRPGVVHSIAHVENYRASSGAIVPFERLVIRHGQDQCWESMRIGYGGDSETNHAFAGALSWLTGLPIEHHKMDPGDPTQQPTV